MFVLLGTYRAIARDYAFRTEQAGVTVLNDIAGEVDGASGSIAVCGLAVVADATTADGCVAASAGDVASDAGGDVLVGAAAPASPISW